MSKKTLAAGTSPFAHLLASAAALGGRALGRRAEDEEKPDAEDEDEKPDAEEPDDKPDAEEPDDKPDAEDEPEEKPEEGKKARRGRKAEDDDEEAKAEDDDDDEEMAQARSEGYAAAQARGAKIFAAASAAKRPDMAAHFAFNETMPSAQAIAMLDMAANGTAPAPSGSRLGRRMAKVVIPNPGTGGTGASKPGEISFGEMAKNAAKKAGIL